MRRQVMVVPSPMAKVVASRWASMVMVMPYPVTVLWRVGSPGCPEPDGETDEGAVPFVDRWVGADERGGFGQVEPRGEALRFPPECGGIHNED